MPKTEDFPVYQLLFKMVCAFVDHTDWVTIKTVWTDDGATFIASVHPEDLEGLLARREENADSIRTILAEVGTKLGRRFSVVFE
jgi:predicted RNA-binding protein YlqC (UPF0109 family)